MKKLLALVILILFMIYCYNTSVKSISKAVNDPSFKPAAAVRPASEQYMMNKKINESMAMEEK